MLNLQNVCKTFAPGTVNEKRALQHIDLELEAGDFAAIVGSNGAGKSTLFGAIAGGFWPDEGSVRLDGQDITRLRPKELAKFRLFARAQAQPDDRAAVPGPAAGHRAPHDH